MFCQLRNRFFCLEHSETLFVYSEIKNAQTTDLQTKIQLLTKNQIVDTFGHLVLKRLHLVYFETFLNTIRITLSSTLSSITAFVMTFNETLSYYPQPFFLEDGIALHRITPSYYDKKGNREEVINIHSMLFVKEGQMTIKVMGNTLQLTQNCYIDIIENELPWTLISTSPDIQAYQLILSKDFLWGLTNNKPPIPISYILGKRVNPIFQIKAAQAPTIVNCLHSIELTLEDTQNRFRKELLQNKVHIFLLEIGNLLSQAKDKEKSSETNRKRGLFTQFVKMLPEHIKEEHSVHFYASQLCVTPQYLGRIVQEFSGRTVYQWISESLIRNIIKLLRDTDLTIQEIADELHFSDQAVLSKMFKRYQGISPQKYRSQIH